MIFSKYSASLIIALRCFHETLSRPKINELLCLLVALVNSLFKKEIQVNRDFVENSFNISALT